MIKFISLNDICKTNWNEWIKEVEEEFKKHENEKSFKDEPFFYSKTITNKNDDSEFENDFISVVTSNPCKVTKTDKNVIIELDYCRCTKEDMIINLDDSNVITVKTDVEFTKDDSIIFNTFDDNKESTIVFDDSVLDNEHISADMINGCLTITIPFAKKVEPKKIKIN